MNFIEKIFSGKPDESVHRQFVRFGKGEYRRRALLNLWKTKSVKIKGSFEFANDFAIFVASLGDVKFSGNIWSKEEIPELGKGKKKEGKWIYEAKDLRSEDVKKVENEVYCFLLNGEGDGIKFKTKGKLPKPGKGEDKVDDKFCQLELDDKYYEKAKEEFFKNVPEGKKISIEHTFKIDEIVVPEGLKKTNDFSRIREEAKRKGKITMKASVDGKEIVKEVDFEA